MARSEDPTLPQLETSTVLAIGGSADFTKLCASVARNFGAAFVASDVARAPTVAAREQPLVIVVPIDVHAFDPKEFADLARDVRAGLVRIREDVQEAVLMAVMAEAITEGSLLRRQPPSSRGPKSSQSSVRRKVTLDEVGTEVELAKAPSSRRG